MVYNCSLTTMYRLENQKNLLQFENDWTLCNKQMVKVNVIQSKVSKSEEQDYYRTPEP